MRKQTTRIQTRKQYIKEDEKNRVETRDATALQSGVKTTTD